ncbi:MAG: phosphatidate cytidylyltransferase [Sphingobacteriia bacterium]|nr:phosphatidate cytidylyltransferase [Sphingobacteriia bacterium]NCC38756.1 phosphatidate cytidylyltransferase [Gammaproteobacteria bacterium]
MAAANDVRRRVVTALILTPLVIAAILLLPTPLLAIGMAVVFLLAAWEWCVLAGITSRPGRIAYLALLGLVMLLFWSWPEWQPWLLGLCLLWWGVQAVRLPRIQQVEVRHGWRLDLLAIGGLVLVGPWVAIVVLHAHSPIGSWLLLFLMLLIWTADSMAYFVGRAWGAGRAKLAPRLSPGKTWVGVYGALAGGAICGLIFAWLQDASLVWTLAILFVCMLTVAISVVGDLYESLLKRERGLKDSGRLLPGHGGMLDRIDSLTAAAPVFALAMAWVLA